MNLSGLAKLSIVTVIILASAIIVHTATASAVSVPAEPDSLLAVGGDVWVASCGGNSVTEILRSNAKVVQVSYGFACPDALAFADGEIWVANQAGSSITELSASTGDFVATLTGPDISDPVSLISVAGGSFWVGNTYTDNAFGPSLAQINASSGDITETVTDPSDLKFILSDPQHIAFDGKDIWVADSGSTYEFNAANGEYLRTLRTIPVNGSGPLTCRGRYLFVDIYNNNGVAVFNVSNGKFVKTLNVFDAGAIANYGNDLLVVSDSPVDTLKEYSASGVFLRTIARSNKDAGYGIRNLLVTGNSVWTANYSSNSVSKYRA